MTSFGRSTLPARRATRSAFEMSGIGANMGASDLVANPWPSTSVMMDVGSSMKRSFHSSAKGPSMSSCFQINKTGRKRAVEGHWKGHTLVISAFYEST